MSDEPICSFFSWPVIAIGFAAYVGLLSARATEAPAAKDPPKLPLTGETLEQILDSYADPKEAQFIEQAPLLQAVAALNASTTEQLGTLVNPKAIFAALMKKPELYRGQVVTQSGILQLVQCLPIPKNDQGVEKLWLCYLSDGRGRLTTIASLEDPAPGLQLKKPASAVGVFLKRLAFPTNRQAKDRLSWAPLSVCRALTAGGPEVPASNQTDIDPRLPVTIPEITLCSLFIGLQLLPYGDHWKVVVGGQDYPINGVFAMTPEILSDDLGVTARRIMAITETKPEADGGVPVPVKFCIHANAQMLAVERVIMKLFRCKFVNIRYTTFGPIPEVKPNQKPDQPAPPNSPLKKSSGLW